MVQEKRDWLIKKRNQRGLSQLEVAKIVDVTQQFYAYIENGTRRPGPEIAQKIADVLDFDWTLFFPKKKKSK